MNILTPPILLKYIKYISKKPIYLLMVIWTLTTSQQCTNTDACGSYTFDLVFLKIIPTLNTTIPNGRPRPIVQTLNGMNNVINVQGSLYYVNNTIFGIKVESYALCNGIPRFSSACCITKTDGCLTLGDETAFQITATLPSTLKCKITIRAVTMASPGNDGYGTFDVYEGSFDVEPISGTPPINNICNIVYKRYYNGYVGSATQYCLFNS